jgi:hypothetical protein
MQPAQPFTMAFLASAREQVLTGAKITPCYLGSKRLARWLRNLELHWPLCLALHGIARLETTLPWHTSRTRSEMVAAAQFAVDSQIE